MTWQEELRQLDADLAAGRLSSDDYRVRRDAVLAKAAGGDPGTPALLQPVTPQPAPVATQQITPPPAIGQSPGLQTQQVVTQQVVPPQPAQPQPVAQTPQAQPTSPTAPPAQPAQAQPTPTEPGQATQVTGGPFPPAFRWKDDTPAVEATSIIPPITDDTPRPAELGVDRTQAVRRDDQPERTQVVRNAAQMGQGAEQSERTQVVTDSQLRAVVSGGYPAQPQLQPQPQQPPQPRPVPSGWNQPQVESAPPWWQAEDPVPELGNASWHQGSELFTSPQKSAGRGKIVLWIVLAVLVLAGVAAGAFFLGKSVGEKRSSAAASTVVHVRTL
ncbi:hypothetical protein [Actinokineospora enzanensis]|uniref:hypothetical protein n=1 Tax=Actinokineospora enzanensis TaxID=155975 RepID=UPI00037A145F|nr:hypothetical protein [Actinokineospora enzanensis]